MRRAALTLALGLCWGSSFLWIKYALDAFSPATITTVRLLLGGAVCFAFCLATRTRLPRTAALLLPVVGAGVLANALPYTLFAIGEQHTSSAIAGLLNSTAPLWTLLVAWAIHDRGADQRSALGITLGLAGSALMVAPAVIASRGELPGVLACLSAALCYGLSYIYIDRFIPTKDYRLPALAAYQLTAAGVLSAPFAFISPGPASASAPNLGTVVPLAILGVLGTGLAYLVNYELIRSAGPVAASVVSYLIPVVAVILGLVVLGEALSPWAILGGIVTLAGVALTRSRPRLPLRLRGP